MIMGGAAQPVYISNQPPFIGGGAQPVVLMQADGVTPIAVGTLAQGDSQSIYNATTAQLLAISKGTAASPDTSVNPLLKVERLITIPESAVGGDGADQLASIVGIGVGTAACETQPVGVFGGAKTSSTAGAPGNDACGLYGVGQALSGATGVGIGGFFAGRRESDAGKYTGVEIAAGNFGTSNVDYNPAGFSGAHGIWLNPTGNADGAAGLTISNTQGRQFDVGIAFTAQVTGGKTGGVKNTSIRDDSNAVNSILINGTHTVGIGVASGAGPVIVGGIALAVAGDRFEVLGPDAFTDPLVTFGSVVFARSYTVQIRNSTGVSRWFIANAANDFLTGTAQGDGGFKVQTSGKKLHIGGTVSVIAVTQGDALSFFQAAGVTKRTGWTPATGTATRTTFATSTVTLPQLAERVKALIDDFHATAGYGLLAT